MTTTFPIHVKVEDVAAIAREKFGEAAFRVIAPDALEYDYRLTFTTPNGAKVTMHHGATADDVVRYLETEGTQ